MRQDRGYFCLPEIDGGIGCTPGLADLIATRLGPQLAHGAMTSGRHFGAAHARALGIVDEVADVPRANTNAATIMVAERAADLISVARPGAAAN